MSPMDIGLRPNNINLHLHCVIGSSIFLFLFHINALFFTTLVIDRYQSFYFSIFSKIMTLESEENLNLNSHTVDT